MDDLLLASPPEPPSTTAAPSPLVSDTATLPETLPLLECVTLALDVAVAWIAFSDGTQPCYVATVDPAAVAGLLSDGAFLALAKDSDALVSDGNVLQFSQSFALLLGYTAEETARLNVRDWDAMFEPQELIPQIGRLISQPRAFETRYRRKDGIIIDGVVSRNRRKFRQKSLYGEEPRNSEKIGR
jgi:PAS domain S-box-containing protein